MRCGRGPLDLQLPGRAGLGRRRGSVPIATLEKAVIEPCRPGSLHDPLPCGILRRGGRRRAATCTRVLEPASILQPAGGFVGSSCRAWAGPKGGEEFSEIPVRLGLFQGFRPPLGIPFGKSPCSTRLFTVISTREGTHNEGMAL